MKKGFELSINFIIVMILCVVILGFGLAIFTKIFTLGEEIEIAMSESAKIKVQQLLDNGAPVALPENVKTIRAGDHYIFGVGINNYGDSNTFSVSIIPDSGFIPTNKIVYDQNSFFLENKDRKFISFLVDIPGNTPSGSYTLSVTVTINGEIYNPPAKKVYINVP